MSEQDKIDKLKQELRRGALVLAVLLQLRQEHYGYSLRKALIDASIDIEESTLYPLLRRLETQGLLISEWREENKRKKRFYLISEMGQTVLEQLLLEGQSMNQSIEHIATKLDD